MTAGFGLPAQQEHTEQQVETDSGERRMSQEIVERLRGAADYRREFGPAEGADIYVKAADEIERLRTERDEAETKLSVLLDTDLTVRDLEAKIRDGVFTLRLVSGPEGGNAIYKLVAAMLWHLLLGEDDEMPPNYRTIEFAIRPAQESDEVRCTAAVLVPGGKSPHEMRVAAEARVERLQAALHGLIAHRGEESDGTTSGWWRAQLRDLLVSDDGGSAQQEHEGKTR